MGQSVSAFGISGMDYAATATDYAYQGVANYLTNWANMSKSDDYAQRAAERSQYYYEQNLLNTPSLQRRGLERAGYNPMLALGHLGGSYSPSFMAQGGAPSFSSTGTNGFNAAEFASAKQAFKDRKAITAGLELDNATKKATIDNIRAQTENIKAHETKTKVDTFTSPLNIFAGGAGAAGAVYSGKKLFGAVKNMFNMLSQKAAPLAGGSAKSLPLPLLIGSSLLAPVLAEGLSDMIQSEDVKKFNEKQGDKINTGWFQHGNWSR